MPRRSASQRGSDDGDDGNDDDDDDAGVMIIPINIVRRFNILNLRHFGVSCVLSISYTM